MSLYRQGIVVGATGDRRDDKAWVGPLGLLLVAGAVTVALVKSKGPNASVPRGESMWVKR